jgi:transcriptional regulator with XRE-family HTH domain
MDRIRQLRKERGLSQVKLAVMADMDPATLNRLERGTGNPNIKTLERVADALGVEVADFFPKVSSRSPYEPTFNDVLAEEQRADAKGPDESVWGAPQNRPVSEEQIPQSAGHHIHVEIQNDLSTEPARVTITRTAFLDMLRRHGLAEPAAREVIEELQRISA